MPWNYRVIKADDAYQIHEVYYNSDGTFGAWTERPVRPMGESVQELEDDLSLMRSAINDTVLIVINGKLEEYDDTRV